MAQTVFADSAQLDSGGASAIAYALSRYSVDPVEAIDTELDGAFLYSGPPHGRMDWGCLDAAFEPSPPPGSPTATPFGYPRDALDDEGARYKTDISFGTNETKCQLGPYGTLAGSWPATWYLHSASNSTYDFTYPTTRVYILVGEVDVTSAVHHADTVLDAITPESNIVSPRAQCVAGMGHEPSVDPNAPHSDPVFWSKLKAAVRWSSGDYGSPDLSLVGSGNTRCAS